MENTKEISCIKDLVLPGDLQKNTKNNAMPHCPNPDCANFHHTDPNDTSWRARHGTYKTKAFGTVERGHCRLCGRTFSTQTFNMDYYVKKPVDYIPLIERLVSTSGQGNIGRFRGMRYEQIQNRYERLARYFLTVHSELRQKIPTEEDFVLDGFESFSWSQYFPNNINILVGEKSELIYTMGFSQLRRKGRKTKKQKERQAELELKYGKAPPNAVELSVARILNDTCKWLQDKDFGPKILKSDEHKAYERALKRVKESDRWLKHQQYSSKTARTVKNPLFTVNYVDRQIRKDQVNHVRETVQFARSPAAMMIRLTVYEGYHNYLMPRRIRDQRKGDWTTRGEYLGIDAVDVLEVLRRHWGSRVFLHKINLWQEEVSTWKLQWKNEGIPYGRRIPSYIAV